MFIGDAENCARYQSWGKVSTVIANPYYGTKYDFIFVYKFCTALILFQKRNPYSSLVFLLTAATQLNFISLSKSILEFESNQPSKPKFKTVTSMKIDLPTSISDWDALKRYKTKHMVPICSSANGNWFFSSLSIALYGDESKC